MFFFDFYLYGDHRDLHVLTHSFPTRRASDLERHPVARGIEGCRRAADPFGACWDQPRFVAPGCLGRKNAAADHREPGLVIMIRAWLDDRDRHPGTAAQNARSGRDPRAAATDHDVIIMRDTTISAARRRHTGKLLGTRACSAITQNRR